jgi:hypothetical protein
VRRMSISFEEQDLHAIKTLQAQLGLAAASDVVRVAVRYLHIPAHYTSEVVKRFVQEAQARRQPGPTHG